MPAIEPPSNEEPLPVEPTRFPAAAAALEGERVAEGDRVGVGVCVSEAELDGDAFNAAPDADGVGVATMVDWGVGAGELENDRAASTAAD